MAADADLARQLDQLHSLAAKRAWKPGVALIDKLAPRLDPLAGLADVPANGDSDRAVLAQVVEMHTRFEADRASLSRFEIEVFDAAYKVLWDPKNAEKDETRMFTGVGRKFRLEAEDVKEILIRHDDLMTSRLAERGAAADAALEAKCGPEPSRSGWNGSMPSVEQYLRRTSHDPNSVDVRNCAAPALAGNACWVTVCDVRAKNAFGASVDRTMRFSIARNPRSASVGLVIASTPM